MGRLTLESTDWDRIKDALRSSFNQRQLDIFIQQKFPRVYDEVRWNDPIAAVIHDLIDVANRFGVLDRVIVAAVRERPERPDLRGVALYYARQPGWTAAFADRALAARLDESAGLELLTTRGDPFLDTTRLARFLIRAERQVCQVRCGPHAGGAHGTGFLVAADLVLTCYHVVKGHFENGVPTSGVVARFDYRCAADGTEPPYHAGEWLPIDPAWPIPRSRWSQADISLAGDPQPDELDFALLKLARRVGLEAPAGDAAARGWVDLSTDAAIPPRQAPVLVVQHPGTGHDNPPQHPLKVTIAPGFEGPNGNGTRLIYTPSTLEGSSGSPVFGPDFRAVALHHNRGEQADEAGLVKNNRGIPLALIRAALPADVRALLVAPPDEGAAP